MVTNNIVIMGNLPAEMTLKIGISGSGYNRAPILEAIKEAFDVPTIETVKKAYDPNRKEIITLEDMKYYRLTATTGYCGEEMVDYIMTADEKELRMAADELTADCAAEFIEQHDYDIECEEDCEAFYEDCHCFIEEITREEYEKEMVM